MTRADPTENRDRYPADWADISKTIKERAARVIPPVDGGISF